MNPVIAQRTTQKRFMIFQALDFFKHVFDGAGLVGLGGTIIIFITATVTDIPKETTLLGVAVIGMSLWQKFRKDRRLQQKHNKAMEIVERMLDKNSDIPYNQDFVDKFLSNDEE